MSHLTYDQSRTIATKTILILGGITIFEVLMALLGKGYLIEGVHLPHILIGGIDDNIECSKGLFDSI